MTRIAELRGAAEMLTREAQAWQGPMDQVTRGAFERRIAELRRRLAVEQAAIEAVIESLSSDLDTAEDAEGQLLDAELELDNREPEKSRWLTTQHP